MPFLINFVILMEPQFTTVELNGFETKKGNYLWGVALTLAWQELKTKIIKEDIKVVSDDVGVVKLVHNFNKAKCSKKDLSEESFYCGSGYGNGAVRRINQ